MGRMNRNKVIFWLCFFFNLALTLNAHIAEYDEYWQQRRADAKKFLEEAYYRDPYNVTYHFNQQVHLHARSMEEEELNQQRRTLSGKRDTGPCRATNPIDACWRCRPDWEKNRKRLADCAIGFGKGTTGGKKGEIYTVTDPSDHDLVNPKPGTLRFAVTRTRPLWIIFARNMIIRLSQELIVASHKTIDARGCNIHIARGAGITIQYVRNVIIHGLHIHNIYPGKGGRIIDSETHNGTRTRSDGDGISLFGATNVWIDHCSLSRGADGLIDVIEGSTAVTISNNHMAHHDEVFLFGAQDNHTEDEKMQVTVAFNHFGKHLVQRMPRCRFGFFHVVNNDYTHWKMYAIGGSNHPIIISQGNRFIAQASTFTKEVTKREAPESEWKHWNWRSHKDLFINGAFFRDSGNDCIPSKDKTQMFTAMPGTKVNELTRFVGPRKCIPGLPC